MDEQSRILLKKFIDKIWSEYSSQVYSDLYRTYHPSTYHGGFTNPNGNFKLALDTIGEAIQKGKSYGLLPVDEAGIAGEVVGLFHLLPRGNSLSYAPSLEILEGDDNYLGTRTTWLVATLLWDVLYDIVEEFRCYCGENGIDPECRGKCMGEFPYLYEDYNKLHDYMVKLNGSGILDTMLRRSDTLNKIQLSPERDYIPTEHPHAGGMFEQVDKFLSRRLSVIKENIYNLSDGELLSEDEQHQLENQMCELFNIHKHEASEHLFKWSIKDVLQEITQPSVSKKKINDLNILGTELQPCSTQPMTGFYRDGYCKTGEGDTGTHTVCAQVDSEFLEFSKSKGNDLITPSNSFPGLKPGDKWCLCANRWDEARKAGLAPEVDYDSTNIKTVDVIGDIVKSNLNENKSPELNPELEEGNTVIVINKKDNVSEFRSYFSGQEPKLYERYKVIEKRYSGHRARYPYHYFLIPDTPKYSHIKLGDATDMSIEDHDDVKALFPWINDWIRAKDREPVNPELAVGDIVRVVDVDGEHARAPKVGEKYEVIKVGETYDEYYDLIALGDSPKIPGVEYTLYRGDTWVLIKDKLNEELDERNYQNPDLKRGDIVIPIDVDKSYGTMHTPDMYKRYKVISGLQMEDGGEIYYYEIEPVDLSDDDRLSGMLVGGGSRRNERLYPDHDLYKLAKEQKERTYLDKLEGMELEYDPEKANTGGIREFSWVDEETGESTDTLLFDINYIRTAPLLTYGGDNDEPEKNELVKFDLILKGDKSGLFNDWFNLDDRETRKKLIDYFNLGTRKSVLLNYFYDNYLKLYGIKKEYLRLENVLIPDSDGIIHNVSGGRQLSEDILDTFKVISKLNKIIKTN